MGTFAKARFAWEVIDSLLRKRVAIVVSGRVRWEEWFETMAVKTAGRDEDGFKADGRAHSGPRPKSITCVLCHRDSPVKPMGRVPRICEGCRDEGWCPSMASISA